MNHGQDKIEIADMSRPWIGLNYFLWRSVDLMMRKKSRLKLDDFIRLYLQCAVDSVEEKKQLGLADWQMTVWLVLVAKSKSKSKSKPKRRRSCRVQRMHAAAPCCQMVVESRFHGQDRRGTPPKKLPLKKNPGAKKSRGAKHPTRPQGNGRRHLRLGAHDTAQQGHFMI